MKTATINFTFEQEVQRGLKSNPKFLSSRYFYDQRGDELFQEIMNMSEYYLTNCEYDIFQKNKDAMLEQFQSEGKAFRLIEFGAGDGYKTKVLLEHFLKKGANFKYSPIDISMNVLDVLKDDLEVRFPQLVVEPLNNEYFKALDELEKSPSIRNVILFLGSNIGNFTYDQAVGFLKQMGEKLSIDDYLMIGFDLKKDPKTILDAYNDASGITKAFNLNLLDRINSELGGNFKIDQFMHWPTYNPLTGTTKSYLVSKVQQSVYIECLDEVYEFGPWEAIDMEISQKYDCPTISRLANDAGFRVEKSYQDDRKYFTNTIFRKNS